MRQDPINDINRPAIIGVIIKLIIRNAGLFIINVGNINNEAAPIIPPHNK